MIENENVQSVHGLQKQTYTVKEVSLILGLCERSAYNYCSTTTQFKVMRLGRTIRIHKQSFDAWFAAQ